MSPKLIARSILLSLIAVVAAIPLYFIYFHTESRTVHHSWPLPLATHNMGLLITLTPLIWIGVVILFAGIIWGVYESIAGLLIMAEWLEPFDSPKRVAARKQREEFRGYKWD